MARLKLTRSEDKNEINDSSRRLRDRFARFRDATASANAAAFAFARGVAGAITWTRRNLSA
jgi:hypothetical protein